MTIVGTIVVGWITFLTKILVQEIYLKEIKIIIALMFFFLIVPSETLKDF
jgi:hypothetical protein